MEEKLKLSVSEITALISRTFEESFYNLYIEGEISGFRAVSSGHWYFSLKDSQSVISAVMWRSMNAGVGFVPTDGQKVLVRGSITVFPARGTYQINCQSMRLCGEGNLLAMLEERKKHYSALGWFDNALKKPVPQRPEKVAVITSATGAALQDILQVTGRRNTGLDIIILPAQVQGQGAASEIACRIREVNRYRLAPVMIVGRGGGSVEDLLAFSEDEVIRAIHESEVPVISAVGHEIDWAISDFVADLRAPTPSAAAELVCGSASEQKEKTAVLKAALIKAVTRKLSEISLKFRAADMRRNTHLVLNKTGMMHLSIEKTVNEMKHAVQDMLLRVRHDIELEKKNVEAMNPSAVLNRGYSIVSTPDGKTVRSVADAGRDSSLRVRFKDGRINVRVVE